MLVLGRFLEVGIWETRQVEGSRAACRGGRIPMMMSPLRKIVLFEEADSGSFGSGLPGMV